MNELAPPAGTQSNVESSSPPHSEAFPPSYSSAADCYRHRGVWWLGRRTLPQLQANRLPHAPHAQVTKVSNFLFTSLSSQTHFLFLFLFKYKWSFHCIIYDTLPALALIKPSTLRNRKRLLG